MGDAWAEEEPDVSADADAELSPRADRRRGVLSDCSACDSASASNIRARRKAERKWAGATEDAFWAVLSTRSLFCTLLVQRISLGLRPVLSCKRAPKTGSALTSRIPAAH